MEMIFTLLFKVLFSAILKVNSENDVSETRDEVLASIEGVVKNESFVYLYVYHQGYINLSLKSIFGDADLYISDTNLYPTYHVDSYDLHSATCGVDLVNVPAKFGSPISIGIYGHSAYETSTFILEVLKKSPSDISSFVKITDEVHENVYGDKPIDHERGQKSGTKVKNKKGDKIASNISELFSLMEVFKLIFL